MSKFNAAKAVRFGEIVPAKGCLMIAVAAAALGLAGPADAIVVGPIDTGGYHGTIEIQYNGFSTENNTQGGNETTWAAGFVTSIFAFGDPGNNFYSSATAHIDRIGVFVYGIADGNIIGPDSSGDFKLYNVGCTGGPYCDGKIHVDFYLLPHSASTNFGGALDVSDRTGTSFTGITTGTPFMQWELVPGFITADVAGGSDPLFDETLTTLFQNVNATSLPAAGNGNFYADCVGGPGCAAFNSGGYVNGADFFGQFDLSSALNTNQQNNGWGGRISDPIENAPPKGVPEPGSLAILGTGIFGFFGFGARARKRR